MKAKLPQKNKIKSSKKCCLKLSQGSALYK